MTAPFPSFSLNGPPLPLQFRKKRQGIPGAVVAGQHGFQALRPPPRLGQGWGDKIFLRLLEEDRPFFSLKLQYRGEHLVLAVLDGKQPRFKSSFFFIRCSIRYASPRSR